MIDLKSKIDKLPYPLRVIIKGTGFLSLVGGIISVVVGFLYGIIWLVSQFPSWMGIAALSLLVICVAGAIIDAE